MTPGFRRFLQRSLSEMEFHLNSIHIHLQQRSTCDLATLDSVARQRSLDDHYKVVDLAPALGGCILVPTTSSSPSRTRNWPGRKGRPCCRTSESWPRTPRHGGRLALENMGPGGCTGDPARLVGLVDDQGAANVGVVIDTGHRNLSGDPATALRLVQDHLITLHLHDNHGDRDEHLLLGNIAWDEVMRALEQPDRVPCGYTQSE